MEEVQRHSDPMHTSGTPQRVHADKYDCNNEKNPVNLMLHDPRS